MTFEFPLRIVWKNLKGIGLNTTAFELMINGESFSYGIMIMRTK